MPSLDSNVFLRHITQDDPSQAQRARQIFHQLADGSVSYTVTEAVLVEIVQVLSSRSLYNLPRADIRTHLVNLIMLRGVHLAHKRSYLRALDLYASVPRLDFVDALLVAQAERTRDPAIVSFDKDFDRLPGITRYEP